MSWLVLGVFVLMALLQNIDNFVLATAYRLKNVVIPTSANLLIALLSGIATAVPVVVAGGLRSEAVQTGLDATAGIAGRGLLLMLGVWTLVGYWRSRLFPQLGEGAFDGKDDHPRSVKALEKVKLIRTSEALVAGTALAVDNLAPSFAFGLINPMRHTPVWAGLFLGALAAGFSVGAVVGGQFSGRKGRAQFQRSLPSFMTPELISGLILIGLALIPADIDDWAADFLKLWMGHLGVLS
jgi:putative Mn2+ efflux pump MntP